MRENKGRLGEDSAYVLMPFERMSALYEHSVVGKDEPRGTPNFSAPFT